jgi:hypothetical protein
MEDKETKMLKEAYMVVLKEFEDAEDDGAEEDSWWWEEGRSRNEPMRTPIETDYSIASQQHKSLAPETTRRPFNSYEQCNKLILSCDSRRQVIHYFCNIIDELTCDDEEAQQKVQSFIETVIEQNEIK